MEKITLIPPNTTHQIIVLESDVGKRLDLYLKQQFPSYSRNFFQQLICQQMVLINNKLELKAKTLTKQNDVVEITFPPITTELPKKEIPKNLDIRIVHEDKHFMIINKPANLTVHPPKITSQEVTLVDWLVYRFNELSRVGYADRPGIVHRLDKDTSGLMLVARNNCAHALLSDMFRNRTIQKTYLAVVKGHPEKNGTINFAITRDPVRRNSMIHIAAEEKKEGKKIRDACTHYEVLEYFDDCALVQAKPVTGRTHQIRVHFSAIGHPLVGDLLYGEKSKKIGRHALHAYSLTFEFNGKKNNFFQNPPQDFQKLIEILRNN